VGFWLIAVFLQYRLLMSARPYLLLVWIGVVFVSVLIHELGHAIAMLRYGLLPDITLHTMGGATAAQGMGRLSRPQRILVAFAGPLAGFIFGGIVFGVIKAFPIIALEPHEAASSLHWAGYEAIGYLLWVNFAWGAVNLLPVLPLDGGHIIEDALGPKRERTALAISFVVAVGVCIWAVSVSWWFVVVIFGLCAYQTYQRYRALSPAPAGKPRPVAPPAEATLQPEVAERLRQAEEALANDRYDEAGTIAELLLTDNPPARVRVQALHVIGWAHLLEDRPDEALRVVKAIKRDGKPDPALLGTALMKKGDATEARNILEAARAEGDDRKEVVGPLIQILIQQGEVARAAAIAFDIVETLSDEDARQMAQIAFEHGTYPWASRLSEAVFERSGRPDDAYDAARSRALEGDSTGALQLLRRAVAAGFSDAARVWSDKALEALRTSEEKGELESLLPRPAK